MAQTVERTGRTFVGMVYSDTHPIVLPAEYVKRVHMFDVPAPLREHAHNSLAGLEGDVWWTLGEFRYSGEADYDTAVCRRNRQGQVEYGIESE